ncbi:class I SAM-dependent methyltransferase [Geotalea sp. SG265]|uniref:class I SAM-dependent methyltransferase n=1 Tax=Geotalea sp. SG265 TaxID=2922867 RepID=UPI001FAF6F5B|nr:class I SAM-dependent methyltransferase [Geotalea sp. SG265]
MDDHAIKESVQQQFDSVAHHYLSNSPMAEVGLLDLIVDLAAPRPEHCSLDVACGAGLLVCCFAPLVASATGVDLSRSMLTAAEQESKRQGLVNASFHLADSEALPFADHSFDIVTCKLAFHYFPDPQRAIREMKRVAKPDGRIVLIDRVAAEDFHTRELHNRIEKLRTPSKVKVYARSEIQSMMEREDLTVLDINRYEQYQDVDEWLATTGAPSIYQQMARDLIVQSLETDREGLGLFRRDGRLTMTHSTAVFVAEPRG